MRFWPGLKDAKCRLYVGVKQDYLASESLWRRSDLGSISGWLAYTRALRRRGGYLYGLLTCSRQVSKGLNLTA